VLLCGIVVPDRLNMHPCGAIFDLSLGADTFKMLKIKEKSSWLGSCMRHFGACGAPAGRA
jgi:hypothetical protein